MLIDASLSSLSRLAHTTAREHVHRSGQKYLRDQAERRQNPPGHERNDQPDDGEHPVAPLTHRGADGPRLGPSVRFWDAKSITPSGAVPNSLRPRSTVQLELFMAGLLVRNAKFERTTHVRVRPPGLLSLRGAPQSGGTVGSRTWRRGLQPGTLADNDEEAMSDRSSQRAHSQLACHEKETRKGLISVRGGARIMNTRTEMERCGWGSHHG